ncbi:hypothetical protein K439DRAFT_1616213 [Ramaria rubella]|nr:hypothetical protein K439DRAFT_1616213 [Ramaria rubella]
MKRIFDVKFPLFFGSLRRRSRKFGARLPCNGFDVQGGTRVHMSPQHVVADLALFLSPSHIPRQTEVIHSPSHIPVQTEDLTPGIGSLHDVGLVLVPDLLDQLLVLCHTADEWSLRPWRFFTVMKATFIESCSEPAVFFNVFSPNFVIQGEYQYNVQRPKYIPPRTNIAKIEESKPVPAGATLIDAHNHIVSLGFLSTLEHACSANKVYESLLTSDDVYWNQLVGACEAVSAGIPTTFSTTRIAPRPAHISTERSTQFATWQSAHILAVGRRLQTTSDQRFVKLGFGYDGVGFESIAAVTKTLVIAKLAGTSFTTVHVVPAPISQPLTKVHTAINALSSKLVTSHFDHATLDDIKMVKKIGVGIACTPETAHYGLWTMRRVRLRGERRQGGTWYRDA